LIPTLFLTLRWGYQPERVQAGIYAIFYTSLASLPLLVGISLFTVLWVLYAYFYYVVIILWLVVCYVCIVFAFSVKLPMFMVHLLLAHVEAHISGSMILAWCV
jgi:NADH-ubiquinone oxidoreductase chain 4